MNKNFFYVDTFDFSRESSGNGGATINNAVIRHLPDKACFIGYTSDDDVPGKLTTKTLFGRTIDVIPVANFSKSGAAKRSLMPGAIRFFRYLQRSRKAWNALGIRIPDRLPDRLLRHGPRQPVAHRASPVGGEILLETL